jgi:hypothetical protein
MRRWIPYVVLLVLLVVILVMAGSCAVPMDDSKLIIRSTGNSWHDIAVGLMATTVEYEGRRFLVFRLNSWNAIFVIEDK